MRNCLTDEGRAEFQEWLDEGIAHLIKNEPLLATTPYNVPWGYEKYAI